MLERAGPPATGVSLGPTDRRIESLRTGWSPDAARRATLDIDAVLDGHVV